MKRLMLPILLLAVSFSVAATLTRESWLPAFQGLFSDASERKPGRVAPRVEIDGDEQANAAENAKHAGQTPPGVGGCSRGATKASPQAGTGEVKSGGGSSGSEGGSGTVADPNAAKPGEKPPEKKPAEKKKGPQSPPAVEGEEGKQLNADLDGFLINADPARIKGFAFDNSQREAELYVAVYVDEAKAFELRCDKREEHKQHGVIWNFEQLVPDGLQDGEQHRVRVYALRKDKPGRKELRWSPRDVKPNSFPTGKLEEASPEKGMTGYAWDPDDAKTAVRVWLSIDGNLVQERNADSENKTLTERKIAPHAKCAFVFTWPAELDDGLEHTVQVMAQDLATREQIELPGSPRVIAGRNGLANKAPVGAFDICNKAVLAGWAWDEDSPASAIQVELWIDGEQFLTLSANSKRDGLKWSNVTPDPNHGWVTTTPGVLLDNKTHTIRAYAVNIPAGVKVELQGSPKTYRQEENTAPMGNYWHADEQWLRGWAADPDLGTQACEIEIYIDGKLWTRVKADARDDSLVGTGYAPNPEHGIAIVPPESVRDGKTHEVTIYALNSPEGPPTSLGTRTIGLNSIIAGFWVQDKLVDTRCAKGLYVNGVSPWFDAYHKDVKVGDVMLEYDSKIAGEAETTTEKFYAWLQTKKKNDLVHFKFWRDGNVYETDLKLGQTIGK